MRRRDFISLLGGAATVPLGARAQQPATQHRIVIFHPAIPTTLLTETGGGSAWRAFFGELRRLGYIEGGNLIIERYSAEGHHERYAGIAREIVMRRPDVIVTGTNPVVTAFNAATSTIPVVAFMLDPLHAGLVTNLSRPGGNITGITLDPGIRRASATGRKDRNHAPVAFTAGSVSSSFASGVTMMPGLIVFIRASRLPQRTASAATRSELRSDPYCHSRKARWESRRLVGESYR